MGLLRASVLAPLLREGGRDGLEGLFPVVGDDGMVDTRVGWDQMPQDPDYADFGRQAEVLTDQVAMCEAAIASLTARRDEAAFMLSLNPLMHRRRTTPTNPEIGAWVDPARVAASELSTRLAVSPATTRGWIDHGEALVRRLPTAGGGLAIGALSPAKTRAMIRAVGEVDWDEADAIETHVLPTAPRRTARQIEHHTAAIAITTNPAAAHQREQRARATRRVTRPATRADGMASLSAIMTAMQAAECWAAIDATARNLKADGDPRTLNQLRADALHAFTIHRVTTAPGLATAPDASMGTQGQAGPTSGAESGTSISAESGTSISAECGADISAAFGATSQFPGTSLRTKNPLDTGSPAGLLETSTPRTPRTPSVTADGHTGPGSGASAGAFPVPAAIRHRDGQCYEEGDPSRSTPGFGNSSGPGSPDVDYAGRLYPGIHPDSSYRAEQGPVRDVPSHVAAGPETPAGPGLRCSEPAVHDPLEPHPGRQGRVGDIPAGRSPADPAGLGLVDSNRVHVDPVEREPVERDPVDQDPVERDPVDRDPVERDPVDRDPVERDPVDRDPVEREPVDRDPVEREPVDRDPVDPDPVDRDPVDWGAVDRDPVDWGAVDLDPVKRQTGSREPVGDVPAGRRPMGQDPVNLGPVERPPGGQLPGGDDARLIAQRRVTTEVAVVIPLATLAGQPESGHLPGHGPVTAEAVREVLALAQSKIRLLATDQSDEAGLADQLAGLIGISPGTYLVPQILKTLLAFKCDTCANPWCTNPAMHADTDHIEPFAQGGQSVPDNLTRLCRWCHALKTFTLTTFSTTASGTTSMTTQLGFNCEGPPPF